jgi:hypothetical protein
VPGPLYSVLIAAGGRVKRIRGRRPPPLRRSLCYVNRPGLAALCISIGPCVGPSESCSPRPSDGGVGRVPPASAAAPPSDPRPTKRSERAGARGTEAAGPRRTRDGQAQGDARGRGTCGWGCNAGQGRGAGGLGVGWGGTRVAEATDPVRPPSVIISPRFWPGRGGRARVRRGPGRCVVWRTGAGWREWRRRTEGRDWYCLGRVWKCLEGSGKV